MNEEEIIMILDAEMQKERGYSMTDQEIYLVQKSIELSKEKRAV